MGDSLEALQAFSQYRQQERRETRQKNIAALRAAGIPFKEKPAALLIRVQGKPPVDFYAGVGRWRVAVPGKQRNLGGGVEAFLKWWAKQ